MSIKNINLRHGKCSRSEWFDRFCDQQHKGWKHTDLRQKSRDIHSGAADIFLIKI